jgi:tRNA-(ms[2]io[6]A)-hydroxylase
MLKAPLPADEEPEARPPWHWVGFGTIAVFAAWLPLAYLAELLRRRITAAWLGELTSAEDTARALDALAPADRAKLGLAMFLVHGAALAVGAFAGGYLVGRFGPSPAGARPSGREGALAGFAAALLASILAWSGITWVPLVTLALSTLFAWLGAKVGARRRAKA